MAMMGNSFHKSTKRIEVHGAVYAIVILDWKSNIARLKTLNVQ